MIEIEKGIEMPDRPLGKPPKYPWREMEVGDSFFVPNMNTADFGGGASTAGKRLGKKFSCRREGNGVRVWRVE